MKEINLGAIDFKPNLRFLKKYIIVFERNEIKLYDYYGNLLDNIRFENRIITNLEILNDNFIIIAFHFSILIMKINFEFFAFYDIIKMPINDIIYNFMIIKNKNLLVISFRDKIIIYEITNSNKKQIQIIYNNRCNTCLNINQNNFICYDYENISLYQNIKGTKIYQLSSKINLIGNKSLTKLNGKILLALLNHEQLYTINLRNMKIEEINLPFIIHHEKVMINEQLFYEKKLSLIVLFIKIKIIFTYILMIFYIILNIIIMNLT